MNTDCKCTCEDNYDYLAFVRIKRKPMKLKDPTHLGGFKTKSGKWTRVTPVVRVVEWNNQENLDNGKEPE